MRTKKVKAAGRLGPRYGIRVRKKITAVEGKQRSKQSCIFCGKEGLKRESKGIWNCKKCGKKFASNAYYIE